MQFQQDELLDDRMSEDIHLVAASKTKRLINFIVDRLFATLLFLGIFIFGFGLLGIPIEGDIANDSIWTQLVMALFVVLYYILMEGAFYGKSIGKIFTKTRALTTDAEYLDFPTVVKRSFCRMIPFEALSFLGQRDSGWHDRWSGTIVIDEELSRW